MQQYVGSFASFADRFLCLVVILVGSVSMPVHRQVVADHLLCLLWP